MTNAPHMATNQQWQGRLSSKQSVETETVNLRFIADKLLIQRGPGGGEMTWPLESLRSTSALSPTADDILLTTSTAPSLSLFVTDPDFLKVLALQTPHLTKRSRQWVFAKPILAISLAIAAIAAAIWQFDLKPTKYIAQSLPETMRTTLGNSVAASLTNKKKRCTAANGERALAKLKSRLLGQQGLTDRFNVKVVEWNLVNAFAVPGNQIILTSALLNRAQSPDEVAGVLAHEIGHGIELHPESGLIRNFGFATVLQMLFGADTLANAGAALLNLQYTRAAEREADTHALELLRNAHVSTGGLVDFFERITKQPEKVSSRLPTLLRTHPHAEERARRAAAVTGYPATPALASADWQALRAICSITQPS